MQCCKHCCKPLNFWNCDKSVLLLTLGLTVSTINVCSKFFAPASFRIACTSFSGVWLTLIVKMQLEKTGISTEENWKVANTYRRDEKKLTPAVSVLSFFARLKSWTSPIGFLDIMLCYHWLRRNGRVSSCCKICEKTIREGVCCHLRLQSCDFYMVSLVKEWCLRTWICEIFLELFQKWRMLKRKCFCADCDGKLRSRNTVKRHRTLQGNGKSLFLFLPLSIYSTKYWTFKDWWNFCCSGFQVLKWKCSERTKYDVLL